MRVSNFWITLVFGLVFGFTQVSAAVLKPGIWRAAITNDHGVQVPFLFEVGSRGGKPILEILNGTNRLLVDEITAGGDSIFIRLPFFDSEFRVVLKGPNMLDGKWVRHLATGNASMPFKASFGQIERFPVAKPSSSNRVPTKSLSGTWRINYPGQTEFSVGIFNQDPSGKVTGSILNEDGDYRFLEGRLTGDSLQLSTFDGSHCYLFTALVTGQDSLIDGTFYAGKAGIQSWTAIRDPKAALPNAYSLTSVKEGHEKISFAFPDMQGNRVSFSDSSFKHKVTIIQFMGSWCPNCMDETAFLATFFQKNHDKVAVVGLAYERTANFERSKHSLESFVRRFNVKYPVLITGFTNDPKQVLQSMPDLNNFFAFPTTLIVDKNGRVRKIHTGFSGPGTGKYYDDFKDEFTSTVLALTNEPLRE